MPDETQAPDQPDQVQNSANDPSNKDENADTNKTDETPVSEESKGSQVDEGYDPATDSAVPDSVLADVIRAELVGGDSPTLQALRDALKEDKK